MAAKLVAAFVVVMLLSLASPAPCETISRERAAVAPPVLWGGLEPGPFAVGFRVVSAHDASRSWATDDEGERTSTGPNGRPIRIAVLFPARPRPRQQKFEFGAYLRLSAGSPAFAESFQKLDVRGVAGLRRFLGKDAAFDALMSMPTAAVLDAAPAPGRFPLVAYSAGLNESVQAANFVLSESLASHGFVVVTVPQLGTDPSTTSLDVTPADLESQTRDLEFAIGATLDAPYVDRRRVATMGHSIGGIVALLVAMRRTDVEAVVGLDATYGFVGSAEIVTRWISYAPREVRAPLLDLRRAGASLDPTVVGALRYSDRTVVELPGMRHGDFTSYPMLALRFPSASQEKDAEAAGRGYRVVCGYVLNFLDATLKGSDAARRFVARSPGENGLGFADTRFTRTPGLERPPSEARFVALLRDVGLARAVETFRRFRDREPNGQIVRAKALNRAGYEALGDGNAPLAVDVFLLNVEAHPSSANAYDSLADGYLGVGDTAKAIAAYERERETPPGDTTATEADKATLKANATEQFKALRAPR